MEKSVDMQVNDVTDVQVQGRATPQLRIPTLVWRMRDKHMTRVTKARQVERISIPKVDCNRWSKRNETIGRSEQNWKYRRRDAATRTTVKSTRRTWRCSNRLPYNDPHRLTTWSSPKRQHSCLATQLAQLSYAWKSDVDAIVDISYHFIPHEPPNRRSIDISTDETVRKKVR